MKRLGAVVFVLALAAASTAWAQRPQGGRGFGGFGGGLGLLSQQSVKDDLKLTEDQSKQVDELAAKQRETFSGFRDLSREERREKFAEIAKEARTKLDSILNADQLKRFRQITLQQRGGEALGDPEVAESLGLSDEQKGRIRELAEKAREEMRGLFGGGDGGDRTEIRQKIDAARAALNEKYQGVLNAEQQGKWKELLGQPFRANCAASAAAVTAPVAAVSVAAIATTTRPAASSPFKA
jgi:Spy/CpxP family protein refolding chaperone